MESLPILWYLQSSSEAANRCIPKKLSTVRPSRGIRQKAVELMDGVGVQQIGRYRIINVIGEGGMGVVYLAVDEMISRQVAIKMLRAPAGDTDVLARFHREVRSTANLQHKNIVRLLRARGSGRRGVLRAVHCREPL